MKNKPMPFHDMMRVVSRPAVVEPKERVHKVSNWQFPLGDKVASLSIRGPSNVNGADMDALVEMCVMFRSSIKRGEELPTTDDYQI